MGGPEAVVRDASRVCRRLVVLESVYESRCDRWLLTRLDHLANWFRGIPVEPLAFDRVDGERLTFSVSATTGQVVSLFQNTEILENGTAFGV